MSSTDNEWNNSHNENIIEVKEEERSLLEMDEDLQRSGGNDTASSKETFVSCRNFEEVKDKLIKCPVYPCEDIVCSRSLEQHFSIHGLPSMDLVQKLESTIDITRHIRRTKHCQKSAILIVKMQDKLTQPIPLIMNMWHATEFAEGLRKCRPDGITIPRTRNMRKNRKEEWYTFWLTSLYKCPYYFNVKIFNGDNINFSNIIKPHLISHDLNLFDVKFNREVLVLEKRCLDTVYNNGKNIMLCLKLVAIDGV